MKEYEIIEYRDMKNILSLTDVSPENVYMYMYQLRADVLYIVEKDCLQGVISIGDLLRYYVEKIPLKPNRNFHFANTFDDKRIDEILKEIPSIHELPIIDQGIFLGIVKTGKKDEDEWKQLKDCIDYGRFGDEEKYLYEEFKKWLLRQKAKVIIYDDILWDEWEKMAPGARTVFKKRTENAAKDDILPLYLIKNMTEPEQRKFFGKNYSEHCVQEFMEDYKKIELISENGIYSINDLISKYYTFKNGYRVTPNNTEERYRIYIYGPCHILGTYAPDNETIEYFLKEELIKKGYPYDVINCGLWKGNKGHLWLYRMLKTDFKETDIVIIGEPACLMRLLKKDKDLEGKYLKFNYFGNTYTEINKENILSHFLDHPHHHDSFINYLDAKNILKDITPLLKQQSDDYFIPWNAIKYYKEYFAINGLHPLDKKTGVILMTCNPFTKGHRYLIEKACEEMELVYIFIVEEEVNGFSFKDRFNMVKLGTHDIEKVKVLPLGKYIASKETFPQYFDRDNTIDIKNTDYDIHMFANTIAKELGITVRYVGDEPNDKITKAYNETMKRILPQYGIEVREIPRKCDENRNVISATVVRKHIKNGDKKGLNAFLPPTTITYLNQIGIIIEKEGKK